MHAPCSRCGVLGWACPPRARYPAAVAGLTLPAIVHFRATLSATHPAAMAMAASSSFWCGGEAAGAARRSGVPSSPTHKSTLMMRCSSGAGLRRHHAPASDSESGKSMAPGPTSVW